jgi:hypothetical protein
MTSSTNKSKDNVYDPNLKYFDFTYKNPILVPYLDNDDLDELNSDTNERLITHSTWHIFKSKITNMTFKLLKYFRIT